MTNPPLPQLQRERERKKKFVFSFAILCRISAPLGMETDER